MARLVTTSCSALLAATAMGVACSSPNAGAGGAAAGTGGATVATSATHGSGTTSTHASTSTTGGGTGGAFVCSPPAAAGSIYEKTAVSYALDNVSMCQYRGEVLLIIDTAAA